MKITWCPYTEWLQRKPCKSQIIGQIIGHIHAMIYFIETTTIAEHPWAVSLWFLYKIDRKAWPLAAEA